MGYQGCGGGWVQGKGSGEVGKGGRDGGAWCE